MYVCYWNVLKVLEMVFRVLGCENTVKSCIFPANQSPWVEGRHAGYHTSSRTSLEPLLKPVHELTGNQTGQGQKQNRYWNRSRTIPVLYRSRNRFTVDQTGIPVFKSDFCIFRTVTGIGPNPYRSPNRSVPICAEKFRNVSELFLGTCNAYDM